MSDEKTDRVEEKERKYSALSRALEALRLVMESQLKTGSGEGANVESLI